MVINVFAIRDSKTEAYLQPFFMEKQAVAIRTLSDCVSDPGHAFGAHPEDYDLFHLGTFSDQDGKFDLLDTPKHIVKLLELKLQEQDNG